MEHIISYQDFKKQFPLNFNVLVADCEGCFYVNLLTIWEKIFIN